LYVTVLTMGFSSTEIRMIRPRVFRQALDPDVGEEPRGPEDPEIAPELAVVDVFALPHGEIVDDRFRSHPLVAHDLDPLQDLLGGQETRHEHEQEQEQERRSFHGR
jgi:hypothetical protein